MSNDTTRVEVGEATRVIAIGSTGPAGPAGGGGGGGAVDSVNGETGVVVLSAADVGAQPVDADLTTIAAANNGAVLAATTASFTTADETKLDGIEAAADVTDAANVAAAGAVMEADTTTAAMGFVVDEDDMTSNSATKVPTQQSVKAYVDAQVGGGGYSDEQAQDAVGAILTDTATIDFTYSDATPSITADVKAGSITAAMVAADVATQAELDAKVDDTAYNATSWNGVTTIAPSKNVVRDQFELLAPLASPALTGNPTAPTASQGDNDTSIATTAFVNAEIAADAVAKTTLDANSVLYAVTDDTPAALAMGASTILARLAAGNIVAATPAQLRTLLDVPTNAEAVLDTLYDANTVLAATTDNTPAAVTMAASTILARLASGDIKAATTSEIKTLLAVAIADVSGLQAALDAKAALAGATFTGDVLVPNDTYGAGWDGATEVPTRNAVYDKIESILDGQTFTGEVIVPDEAYDATAWNADLSVPTKNAVRDQIELLAPLASPALTGNPTVPTQAAGTNNTRAASTAYADALVSDTAYNATSWNAVTGIAPSKNAVRDEIELRATLASPTFTGTPAAPTAAQGTSTTQVATTAFVNAEIAADAPSKSAFPDWVSIALSDETTAITTGTAKVTWRAPFAMTITAVRASLATASTSGIPTVDINDGGTTILSTKLTIDANEKTSTTAATAAVISDSAIADDAEITFDIDVAGTGAKGLKVTIYYTRAA